MTVFNRLKNNVSKVMPFMGAAWLVHLACACYYHEPLLDVATIHYKIGGFIAGIIIITALEYILD